MWVADSCSISTTSYKYVALIRVTAGYFYDTFANELCFYGIYFYVIYIYGRYFYRALKI